MSNTVAANHNWDSLNLVCWLQNEIKYLEEIQRTEFGDGRLSAFRRVQEAIDEGRKLPSTTPTQAKR